MNKAQLMNPKAIHPVVVVEIKDAGGETYYVYSAPNGPRFRIKGSVYLYGIAEGIQVAVASPATWWRREKLIGIYATTPYDVVVEWMLSGEGSNNLLPQQRELLEAFLYTHPNFDSLRDGLEFNGLITLSNAQLHNLCNAL